MGRQMSMADSDLTIPPFLDRRPGNGLPALIDRASARLIAARSSAEVLEAKAIAESALHYAKVTQAANETHADCLRIITRAEMRMANEYDAAKKRGAVADVGQRANVRGSDISDMDELGIDRRRLSEWRETRDAGEAVVEQAISSALAEGRAPTKSDIRNHVRGTFGTGDNEWFTPAEYIAAARKALGAIDLDPATHPEAQKVVGAQRYFTKSDDGLSKEWRGRVWLNPPYAQPHIANFVAKMVSELPHITAAIMLTHNYTDTTWFQQAASHAQAICFTRGRIKFYSPSGEIAAPTQGQAFFYFGENTEAFSDQFSQFGFVMVPRC
jgi:phage N-6-adenine-methyltransferase